MIGSYNGTPIIETSVGLNLENSNIFVFHIAHHSLHLTDAMLYLKIQTVRKSTFISKILRTKKKQKKTLKIQS